MWDCVMYVLFLNTFIIILNCSHILSMFCLLGCCECPKNPKKMVSVRNSCNFPSTKLWRLHTVRRDRWLRYCHERAVSVCPPYLILPHLCLKMALGLQMGYLLVYLALKVQNDALESTPWETMSCMRHCHISTSYECKCPEDAVTWF